MLYTCRKHKQIHQRTLIAIKPITNSTYQKPNHNNNNSQIQHTKNPITTTTIHKFSIAKTQTQQKYTNSTHNNIPKTHWILHSSIPKINQQKHISTSHWPNPFYCQRNPKPKAQSPNPFHRRRQSNSNPKSQTPNDGVNELNQNNPNNAAAAVPNG